MAHTGVTGPQSGRTPRTRAEEVGTDPAGFRADVSYDATVGLPAGMKRSGGQYDDRAEAAQPQAGKRPSDPTPFRK